MTIDDFYDIPTLWKVHAGMAIALGLAAYYASRSLIATLVVAVMTVLVVFAPYVEPEQLAEVQRVHGEDYEIHAWLSQALIGIGALAGFISGWREKKNRQDK